MRCAKANGEKWTFSRGYCIVNSFFKYKNKLNFCHHLGACVSDKFQYLDGKSTGGDGTADENM